ncbi:conserved hypothetical protein [Paenibacillus curdlanolyticus YK9]|uniref:Uncharacterized protein n=1 Tax=Paenibacillus curdlanolyticus YK9 TaxID=717606 RepID=E0IFJ5_9BACL|nr:hypothetical protein [Paenibacillus curdlanolyticus]EFM08971.1 conserved hypothetical protein [Paenibacillus curdlanolyticus YK9]
MIERLTALEQRLINQHHRDLFLHTKHTIKAIDDLAEQHRLLSAAHAINGYKIVGSEEALFYETLAQAKEQILLTLEKTLDDLEHKGDKHYDKNFKDGVE